jgi:glucose 1-dehydrogenase
MKAITVVPGKPDQVRVDDLDEPATAEGSVLVKGRLLGICGTDTDIVRQEGYGWPPPGQDRLLIGHESLGEVLEAPEGSGLAPGDLVAGIVRRPDPVPCGPCSHDEWDFCRNGRYTERGIKERAGYGSQRWRIEPEFAIKLDSGLGDCGVLMEPASVLAKAWEQTDYISTRSSWRPQVALVTGAGPVGLFAALLGVQRGLEVHVLDLNDQGPKVQLVEDLGAHFHTGEVKDLGVKPDVVMECTGYGPLVFSLADLVSPNAVICLVGFAPNSKTASMALGLVTEQIVLKNTVMFGSVNADRGNYEQAADALAKADRGWLQRVITRRVPMSGFADALEKRHDDVKVVVDLSAEEG